MTNHASVAGALLLFTLGGIITAFFSVSLAWLTSKAGWGWVLFVGMIVPSFTWVVQMTASACLMRGDAWKAYWCDLSRVCVVGSAALMPAAIANVLIDGISGWWSVANVLVSVLSMAYLLLRFSKRVRSIGWPISWCATIALNMTLFVLASRSWW